MSEARRPGTSLGRDPGVDSGENLGPGQKHAGATVIVLFAVAFGIFTHFAAPSVTTGDSGEFMTAAATLSFAHPPAYPLYALMAKCFVTAIPFGSVPYRINIFSALVSALTLVVLFALANDLLKNKNQALLLIVAIGLTRSYFHNSLITEVFALNTLFVSAVLLALLRGQYLPAAFLIGLGVGNHQIVVFMGPVLLWMARRKVQFIHLSLAGLIGFSVYAMLPIRSRRNPPLNWGEPTTISKTWRTITRKDYGTMTLSIGEAPQRTLGNQARQVGRFAKQLALEVPWWVLLLGFVGLIRYRYFFAVFVLAGPVFYLLGNLPFNAQSVGIMGRFMIWPVVMLMLGFCGILQRQKWVGLAALAVLIVMIAPKRFVEGREIRQGRLVYDYGNAMLRTLPPKAALFMDGGDDAFYSLAMLHYVMGKRPDVELHDRGGLIFKHPYGPDFRALPKEQKVLRRQTVEKEYVGRRPLFYSTMDSNVLPGAKQEQVGFLYAVNPHPSPLPQGEREHDSKEHGSLSLSGEGRGEGSWPLIVLRGLYPTLSADEYRVRALAAFFPYMQGFYKHAAYIGYDVDWLHINLSYTLAHAAYQKLLEGKLKESEALYREWIQIQPEEPQAYGNLGVVLEKQGRLDEARAQYTLAADKFPTAYDPVYNLGVLAWTAGDWSTAAKYFEETLRRNPSHPSAAAFRDKALQRIKNGK